MNLILTRKTRRVRCQECRAKLGEKSWVHRYYSRVVGPFCSPACCRKHVQALENAPVDYLPPCR